MIQSGHQPTSGELCEEDDGGLGEKDKVIHGMVGSRTNLSSRPGTARRPTSFAIRPVGDEPQMSAAPVAPYLHAKPTKVGATLFVGRVGVLGSSSTLPTSLPMPCEWDAR